VKEFKVLTKLSL